LSPRLDPLMPTFREHYHCIR